MDLKSVRLKIPICWSSIQTDFQEHIIFSLVPADKSADELFLIMT